jgi:transposase-like protein
MVEQVKDTDVDALEKEMEGARRATGISFSSATAATPEPADPEVPEKASRRRFTAKYKLDILEQADGCQPGQIGALLRREGLYSSHLTTWRRQREAGALEALGPRKRGRKAKARDAQTQRLSELERENQRLRQRLFQAQTIIEVQKKVSTLLGIPLESPDSTEEN